LTEKKVDHEHIIMLFFLCHLFFQYSRVEVRMTGSRITYCIGRLGKPELKIRVKDYDFDTFDHRKNCVVVTC